MVHPSLPVKSLKELLALARSKPGQMSFSSSGIYGALHMPMEMFLHAAKLKMRHVPTTGGGPAITALLGGHVEMTAGGPAAISGHVRSGKMRTIASWGGSRIPSFQDVPTFKELGYKWVDGAYRGVAVPKSTPPDARKKVSDMMAALNQDPQILKWMADGGFEVVDIPYDKNAAFMKERGKEYTEIVKRMGLVK